MGEEIQKNEVVDALALMPAQSVSKYTEEDEKAVTSGGWLPRLGLMASSSEAVKVGNITPGVYGLTKNDKLNPDNLGKEVNVLVISWHPKAMDLTSGAPVSFYDIKSQAFKDVARRSVPKDSKCMYGSEFLIWIPGQATLATYYMGSKSARRASPDLLDLMKKAAIAKGLESGYSPTKATLKVKFVEKSATNSYSFHAPVITPCTVPMTVSPDPEELTVELEKFNNPPESAVETVEEVPAGGRAR